MATFLCGLLLAVIVGAALRRPPTDAERAKVQRSRIFWW